MISIEIEKDKVYAAVSGDNFHEMIDLLKSFRANFKPDTKKWELPITKYSMLKERAEAMGDYVDIDYESEKELEKYKASLKELVLSRKRKSWHQELLNFPPLVGKHPYEDFQIVDIVRSMNQNRFLFNWRMGLGKSYALSAILSHGWFYNDFDKCIVFSSNIGVLNVQNEILKFSKTLKPEDIITFSSAASADYEDRDIFNTEKYPQKVFVMTYDFLKTVSNFYYDKAKGTKRKPKPSAKVDYRKSFMPIKEWLGGKDGCIFLDEVHCLSHVSSRRSAIMNWAIQEFKFRYLFSATPADRYEKLYPLCKNLDKDLVDGLGYQEWCAEYNEVGTVYSQWAINPEKWRLDKIGELNKKLLDVYGTKRGKECLDLPEHIIHKPFYVDMSKKQREIYQKLSQWGVQQAQEAAKFTGANVTHKIVSIFPFLQLSVDNPSSLLRSAQFKNMPDDLKKAIQNFNYEKDSTKLDLVDTIVDERVNEYEEKGILWYYHPDTATSLMRKFAKYKPVQIGAETEKESRLTIVNDFLKSPDKKLLIASINVMNTSLTLIECAFAVYVESTYNYVDYDQSLGRIHRPGVDHIVNTYKVRYNDSIDNLQELNLKTKGETMNSLMNKDYIEADMWKKLFNFQESMSL